MRTPVANGLTPDTKVSLQGLEIGRVRNVIPIFDPETHQLRFLAQLEINVAFDDGTPLLLPTSTTAVIARSTPIAAPAIQLTMPTIAIAGQAMLQPGDTIHSETKDDVLQSVVGRVEGLTEDIANTMEDIRRLLATGTGTIAEVQSHIATTVPLVDSILSRVSQNLSETEGLLADLTPRVGVVQDSVLATIATARTTIAGFDSLRMSVQTLAVVNEASIEEILRQLARTSAVLGNFADQVSRRPHRLLTGVTPPPAVDSMATRQ